MLLNFTLRDIVMSSDQVTDCSVRGSYRDCDMTRTGVNPVHWGTPSALLHDYRAFFSLD